MLTVLALLFASFPFTQIVPLDTYNQPYAVTFGALALGLNLRFLGNLPVADRWALAGLAGLGAILLAFESINGLEGREIVYMLSYLTPVLLVPPLRQLMQDRPDIARQVMSFAVLAWVGVSLVQRLYDVSFLNFLASDAENLAENIAASGRGVIGLAPEPTHHGLHMLCLAAALYLLDGKKWIVSMALVSPIAFAGSSFSVLAMACGLTVWAATNPLRRSWYFLAVAAVLVIGATVPFLLDSQTRIAMFVNQIQTEGLEVLVSDASANARLSGIFLPIGEMIQRAGVPLGLSLRSWMEMRDHILTQNSWVFSLSGSGPASGFGLLLVQGGIFALPIVLLIGKRLLFDLRETTKGALSAITFFVFCGQIYLATPSFGLVYAAALVAIANERRRQLHRQRRMAPPLVPVTRNMGSAGVAV